MELMCISEQNLLFCFFALTGFDVASVCSTEPDPDMVPVDVSKLVLVPDGKGLYTVCFTPDKRPKDWKVGLCKSNLMW